jgi:hypothetical protein
LSPYRAGARPAEASPVIGAGGIARSAYGHSGVAMEPGDAGRSRHQAVQ